MAYSKNTWQSGDVVTSAKLNNIENGIANMNGTISVSGTSGSYVLSATYNEIMALLGNGVIPFFTATIMNGNLIFTLIKYISGGGMYGAMFKEAENNNVITFVATSADGVMNEYNE